MEEPEKIRNVSSNALRIEYSDAIDLARLVDNKRTVPVEYFFQMSGVFPFGSLDDNLKRFKIIVTRIWWVLVNDQT